MKSLIDKLEKNTVLSKEEYAFLIENFDGEISEYLFEKARNVRIKNYGRDVYIRGLIEFTSYCKNNCLYCGLRCGNRNAERYRLSKSEILSCCEKGYALGFRTFVLQGGEDPYFTDERMLDIIKSIKSGYPDCALTLSVGEKETRLDPPRAGARDNRRRHLASAHAGVYRNASKRGENRGAALSFARRLQAEGARDSLHARERQASGQGAR